MEYHLLLLATALAVSACPEEGKHYLPHENSCSKYIVCDNGKETVQMCPEDWHFDTKAEICAPKGQVNCQILSSKQEIQTSSVQPSCPPLQPTTENVLDPICGNRIIPYQKVSFSKSCSYYYMCIFRKAYLEKCPLDLEFSPIILDCLPSTMANCHEKNPNDTTIFTASTSTWPTSNINTFKATESTSEKIPSSPKIISADTTSPSLSTDSILRPIIQTASPIIKIISYKPETTISSFETNPTLSETTASISETTLHNSETNSPTPDTQFTSESSSVCIENSLYPSEENCNEYYSCNNGIIDLNHCPFDFEFSPTLLWCLPSNLAKCSTTTESPILLHSDCEEGKAYPDIYSCKHYFICTQKELRRVSCSDDYEFNSVYNQCVPSYIANCKMKKTHETKVETSSHENNSTPYTPDATPPSEAMHVPTGTMSETLIPTSEQTFPITEASVSLEENSPFDPVHLNLKPPIISYKPKPWIIYNKKVITTELPKTDPTFTTSHPNMPRIIILQNNLKPIIIDKTLYTPAKSTPAQPITETIESISNQKQPTIVETQHTSQEKQSKVELETRTEDIQTDSSKQVTSEESQSAIFQTESMLEVIQPTTDRTHPISEEIPKYDETQSTFTETNTYDEQPTTEPAVSKIEATSTTFDSKSFTVRIVPITEPTLLISEITLPTKTERTLSSFEENKPSSVQTPLTIKIIEYNNDKSKPKSKETEPKYDEIPDKTETAWEKTQSNHSTRHTSEEISNNENKQYVSNQTLPEYDYQYTSAETQPKTEQTQLKTDEHYFNSVDKVDTSTEETKPKDDNNESNETQTSLEQTMETETTKHCENGKLQPDYENCNIYYECRHNRLVTKTCPYDYEFSRNFLWCLPPIIAQCSSNGNSIHTTKSEECIEGQLYRDHEDCHRYFECKDGKIQNRTCLRDHIFNESMSICLPAEVTPCHTRRVTKSQSTIENTKISNNKCPFREDEPIIYYSDDKDCKYYYVCLYGVKHRLKCQDDYEFSTLYSTCLPQWQARCSNTTYAPEPGPCQRTDMPMYFEPKCDSCKEYYFCYNGVQYLEKCPDEMEFSAMHERCMPKHEAKCTIRSGDKK